MRNVPKDCDEKRLRELFQQAAGNDGRPRIVQAKIARDEESAVEGDKGKSRGFGFVEFAEHKHALAALRKLNNNATVRACACL